MFAMRRFTIVAMSGGPSGPEPDADQVQSLSREW